MSPKSAAKSPLARLRAVATRQGVMPSADPPAERASLAPVAGLLFLSGMCGLVFQVSWFREFRLGVRRLHRRVVRRAGSVHGRTGHRQCRVGKTGGSGQEPAGLVRPAGTLDRPGGRLESSADRRVARPLYFLGRAACAGLSAGHRRAAGDFGTGSGHSHVSDGRDVAGGGPRGDGSRGPPAPRRRSALRREHAGSGGGSAGQHVLCPGVLRHAEQRSGWHVWSTRARHCPRWRCATLRCARRGGRAQNAARTRGESESGNEQVVSASDQVSLAVSVAGAHHLWRGRQSQASRSSSWNSFGTACSARFSAGPPSRSG